MKQSNQDRFTTKFTTKGFFCFSAVRRCQLLAARAPKLRKAVRDAKSVPLSITYQPKLRLPRCFLLMNSARHIRAYCLIALRRRAEWPYRKYPAQPHRNAFTSCAIASGGSSLRCRSAP